MEVALSYSFDEDSIIKMQKDLNHLLTHLDSQNVKKLITENCTIRSKNNETIINGALIEMYDYSSISATAPDRLRLRMGYDVSSSQFVFSMWGNVPTTGLPSSNNSPDIFINSSGNAAFSGNINTSHNAYIGDNIFLGETGSTVSKGIYFNSSTPTLAEAEGTSDMKSAIYTEDDAGTLIANINSTGVIDIVTYQGLYIQRNTDTNIGSSYSGIQILSSNFNKNYFPHVIIGDPARYNFWVGHSNESTCAVEPKGYIDKSVHWSLSDHLKTCWCEQGKIFEDFNSTADWVPNAFCRVEVASSNKKAYSTGSLLLANTSTSANDIQFYKFYSGIDLNVSNSGRSMSTNTMFYMLFYLYDLNRINTLSTKAMQVELASSSGLSNKYRYYLGGSTSASALSTGWNLILQRVDIPYSYSGVFNPIDLKYMRVSFETKTNSTGAIAAFASMGIVRNLDNYPTVPNLFPKFDDLLNGYAEAMMNVGFEGNWMMRRISSTGIAMSAMKALSTNGASIYPQYELAYDLTYTKASIYTGDIKIQARVKCENDKGALPFIGAYMIEGSKPMESTSNSFGIVASSHVIKLVNTYNSTALEDWTDNISVNHNDVFDITVWKEDPPINSTYSADSQIRALVEKVGTTQMYAFSYQWQKAIWRDYRFTPMVSSWETDAPASIMDMEISRR